MFVMLSMKCICNRASVSGKTVERPESFRYTVCPEACAPKSADLLFGTQQNVQYTTGVFSTSKIDLG